MESTAGVVDTTAAGMLMTPIAFVLKVRVFLGGKQATEGSEALAGPNSLSGQHEGPLIGC